MGGKRYDPAALPNGTACDGSVLLDHVEQFHTQIAEGWAGFRPGHDRPSQVGLHRGFVVEQVNPPQTV